MEQLELHALSIVLSFLTETEGTSLLITKRQYARLLPVFRLKSNGVAADFLVVNGQRPTRTIIKYRHKFIPVPVQNSSVLLARLNTKRLFQRKERPPVGLTTSQIAHQEWRNMKRNATTNDNNNTPPASWHVPSRELLRFLDTPSNGDDEFLHIPAQTILVSYPRSGNTLMRTLLERVTGYVTGSDTRPDRNLSRALAEQHNLVGEGVTHSSTVRVVKTHWPERIGNARYTARRAILVVRNPYDAIDSYWNMNATCSHTKSLTNAVYDQFRDKFARLVRNEIQIWLAFHDYWIAQATVPVCIVRYEDLIQNPAHEMTRVLQFLWQVDRLSLFWRQRVQHVTGSGAVHGMGSYQPRSSPSSTTMSIGKSLRKKGHMTEDLVQYMHECAAAATTTSPQQPQHRRLASNYLVDFGYDCMQHDFPNNFASPPPLPSHLIVCANRRGSVRVNDGSVEIRAKDCEFGRALQKWRHSVTKNDSEPLPTIA